ncbi:MAG: sialate O-acetylesterase [Verrucomicrobiales bacterium]|nr:sialate O-acetylesterase [Verrucomicrobiales bacterium]
MICRIFATLLLLIFPVISPAGPQFATCFGDDSVLQRGETTQVFGFDADPTTKLMVQFGDHSAEASIQPNGRWNATLKNLAATDVGLTLKLIENNTVVDALSGIVVGDIWIAAGQSNMQMQVRQMQQGMPPAGDWADSANLPQIRFRRVNDAVNPDQNLESNQLEERAPWLKMTPEHVGHFSAVAAVFAREIATTVKCPIGIVDLSWGGKPIEPFIPSDHFSTPLLRHIKDLADTGKLEELKSLHGGVIIRNPEGYPAAIFNARMAPLSEMRIKGFLWYQAESNAGKGEDPREYREKMTALASGWRERWNQRELPFYFVQLPAYGPAAGWIRMREEQRRALALIPNSAMAVTIDIKGEGIHPPDKLEVGKRLASCALNHTYGLKHIATTGPVYQSHETDGSAIVVHFSNTEGGLVVGDRPLFSEVNFTDRKLQWFEVAGEDGVWHSASATIKADTVRVSSLQEPAPVAVRYACHTNPQGGNLYNRAGLPASPFCSDLTMLPWEDQN